MTVRSTNLGTIAVVNPTSGSAHSASVGDPSGWGYQAATYGSTSNYATEWEHPDKYGTLTKYLSKVFGDDSKKIVAIFENNAISLEDHLASAYLSINGGTVYGDVSIGKNLTVYDEIYLGTKPVDSYLCPIGSIMAYAGTQAPTGWLMCDGAAVSTSTYPGLYAAIGTAFNTIGGASAPASGLFRVPNLKGRVIVGVDSADTDFDSRSDYGGAKTVALSISEMPAHTHTQIAKYQGGTTSGAHVNLDTTINNNDYGYAQTGSTGSGAAHQNMPPYAVLNYIIKI